MNDLRLETALVFVVGLVVGGQVNRGIYRLAWTPRPISPWCAAPNDLPPRSWLDRIPVWGWWRLRRESHVHGAAFWVRPALIEIGLAALLAWLYYFELTGGLVPSQVPLPVLKAWTFWHSFLAHALLIAMMAVCTFIDIDEKTIPDAITIPGTWAGLILCTLFPSALLPDIDLSKQPLEIMPLVLTAPNPWATWLDAPNGLAIGLACFATWCYALLPKTWWVRSGLGKALVYLAASIGRHPASRWILAMWLAGSLGIVAGWKWGGEHWQGLLSSLVGLAYGGGIVWAVRVIGKWALQREAMGFGDVTLLAMIGTFVGWQASLIIFFLAPFAGVVLALFQWILTGRRDIAYGPFLCFAALAVLVGWVPIWFVRCRILFGLGWWVTALVAFCLLLMAGMLAFWRWLRPDIRGR